MKRGGVKEAWTLEGQREVGPWQSTNFHKQNHKRALCQWLPALRSGAKPGLHTPVKRVSPLNQTGKECVVQLKALGEKMCTRVLNEEWQEGDGAVSFVGERGGKKKSYVHAGFTDLDELKFLISVRVKWVAQTECTDVKLWGKKDYWETERERDPQTKFRTFICAVNVWRGELVSSWYSWWRLGKVFRFFWMSLCQVLISSIQSCETRCLLDY